MSTRSRRSAAGDAGAVLNPATIQLLDTGRLKKELESRGLPTTGSKNVLADRLEAAVTGNIDGEAEVLTSPQNIRPKRTSRKSDLTVKTEQLSQPLTEVAPSPAVVKAEKKKPPPRRKTAKQTVEIAPVAVTTSETEVVVKEEEEEEEEVIVKSSRTSARKRVLPSATPSVTESPQSLVKGRNENDADKSSSPRKRLSLPRTRLSPTPAPPKKRKLQVPLSVKEEPTDMTDKNLSSDSEDEVPLLSLLPPNNAPAVPVVVRKSVPTPKSPSKLQKAPRKTRPEKTSFVPVVQPKPRMPVVTPVQQATTESDSDNEMPLLSRLPAEGQMASSYSMPATSKEPDCHSHSTRTRNRSHHPSSTTKSFGLELAYDVYSTDADDSSQPVHSEPQKNKRVKQEERDWEPLPECERRKEKKHSLASSSDVPAASNIRREQELKRISSNEDRPRAKPITQLWAEKMKELKEKEKAAAEMKPLSVKTEDLPSTSADGLDTRRGSGSSTSGKRARLFSKGTPSPVTPSPSNDLLETIMGGQSEMLANKKRKQEQEERERLDREASRIDRERLTSAVAESMRCPATPSSSSNSPYLYSPAGHRFNNSSLAAPPPPPPPRAPYQQESALNRLVAPPPPPYIPPPPPHLGKTNSFSTHGEGSSGENSRPRSREMLMALPPPPPPPRLLVLKKDLPASSEKLAQQKLLKDRFDITPIEGRTPITVPQTPAVSVESDPPRSPVRTAQSPAELSQPQPNELVESVKQALLMVLQQQQQQNQSVHEEPSHTKSDEISYSVLTHVIPCGNDTDVPDEMIIEDVLYGVVDDVCRVEEEQSRSGEDKRRKISHEPTIMNEAERRQTLDLLRQRISAAAPEGDEEEYDPLEVSTVAGFDDYVPSAVGTRNQTMVDNDDDAYSIDSDQAYEMENHQGDMSDDGEMEEEDDDHGDDGNKIVLNPRDLIEKANAVLQSLTIPKPAVEEEKPKEEEGPEYVQMVLEEGEGEGEEEDSERAPPEFHGEPVPSDDDDDLFEIAAGLVKPKKKQKDIVPEEERLPSDELIEPDYYNGDLHIKGGAESWQIEPENADGLAIMWGGVKSNMGIRLPFRDVRHHRDSDEDSDEVAAEVTKKVNMKIAFQIKVTEFLSTKQLPFEELDPHDVRVGFSLRGTSTILGESADSWSFSSFGKKATDGVFEEFGKPFHLNDVVTACFDFTTNSISYHINDEFIGTAFRDVHLPDGSALFPHICIKNCNVAVNFGTFPTGTENWIRKPNWRFLTELGRGDLETTVRPPESKNECTVLMMVGLPGVGKTTWVRSYLKEHPDENWTVVQAELVMNAMKVDGVSRKRARHGRWDMVMGLVGKALHRWILLAARRRRNYILDLTNVTREARKKRLALFEEFRRKCVVLVPPADEMLDRQTRQARQEGTALMPPEAMLELKATMSLPSMEEEPVDELYFIEPSIHRIQDAIDLVSKMNEEARPWFQKKYRRRRGGRGMMSSREFPREEPKRITAPMAPLPKLNLTITDPGTTKETGPKSAGSTGTPSGGSVAFSPNIPPPSISNGTTQLTKELVTPSSVPTESSTKSIKIILHHTHLPPPSGPPTHLPPPSGPPTHLPPPSGPPTHLPPPSGPPTHLPPPSMSVPPPSLPSSLSNTAPPQKVNAINSEEHLTMDNHIEKAATVTSTSQDTSLLNSSTISVESEADTTTAESESQQGALSTASGVDAATSGVAGGLTAKPSLAMVDVTVPPPIFNIKIPPCSPAKKTVAEEKAVEAVISAAPVRYDWPIPSSQSSTIAALAVIPDAPVPPPSVPDISEEELAELRESNSARSGAGASSMEAVLNSRMRALHMKRKQKLTQHEASKAVVPTLVDHTVSTSKVPLGPQLPPSLMKATPAIDNDMEHDSKHMGTSIVTTQVSFLDMSMPPPTPTLAQPQMVGGMGLNLSIPPPSDFYLPPTMMNDSPVAYSVDRRNSMGSYQSPSPITPQQHSVLNAAMAPYLSSADSLSVGGSRMGVSATQPPSIPPNNMAQVSPYMNMNVPPPNMYMHQPPAMNPGPMSFPPPRPGWS